MMSCPGHGGTRTLPNVDVVVLPWLPRCVLGLCCRVISPSLFLYEPTISANARYQPKRLLRSFINMVV